MRNCSEINELLSAYLDDFLEPDEKNQVEKHLKQCSECQRELKELRETIQMFNDLNDEELIPPASFRRELRQKLEREAKTEKNNFLDKFISYCNNFRFKAWLPLATAVVLLIIIIPVAISGLGPMGLKSEMAKDSGPEMYNISGSSNVVKFSSNAEEQKMMRDGIAPELTESQVQDSDMGSLEIERKIIREGHLNLEVDNYKQTTTKINSLVQEMRGYIVNENTYIYDQQRKLLAGNLTVRIPEGRFDEALNRFEEMGNATNRSVNSQDVTEEYVDVESRLKAMRLKEERLLSLLGKSGTLGDVLAVENELARTRADLEALEGRLKYLNNRTDLSTINVNISETLTPVKQIKTTGLQGVMLRFQEAFIKSINSIIIGFGNLVVAIGAYIPFIILLMIGIGFLVLMWRKIKKTSK